jgi:hypothetical protein
VWKCAYNFHSDIIYRRGFPAADCHRWWNIGCITMNLQESIKKWSGNRCHLPGPKNSELCLLPAKWCWHCFET